MFSDYYGNKLSASNRSGVFPDIKKPKPPLILCVLDTSHAWEISVFLNHSLPYLLRWGFSVT